MKAKTLRNGITKIVFEAVIAVAVMLTFVTLDGKMVKAESPKTYSFEGTDGTIKIGMGTVIHEGDTIRFSTSNHYCFIFNNSESDGFYINALEEGKAEDNKVTEWTVGRTSLEIKIDNTIGNLLPGWYYTGNAFGVGFIDFKEDTRYYDINLTQPHTHILESLTANGDKLTAKCKNADGNCNVNDGGVGTISLHLAPDVSNYYRTSYMSDFNAVTGLHVSEQDIELYKVETVGATTGGTKVNGIPKEGGHYYASLTVDDKTAVKAFEIQPFSWLEKNYYGRKIWHTNLYSVNQDDAYRLVIYCNECGERLIYDKVNEKWTKWETCYHFVEEDPNLRDDHADSQIPNSKPDKREDKKEYTKETSSSAKTESAKVKSVLPQKTVTIASGSVAEDLKVLNVNDKTKVNQSLLVNNFAQKVGKKARILDTFSLHTNRMLGTENGKAKTLKWANLEKNPQVVYACCYNQTDKAYFIQGVLDKNGVATFNNFLLRDATNVTIFVLE